MLTTDNRHFCALCGSSVFAVPNAAERWKVNVGAFDDAPTDFTPAYELWTPRRERWLDPVDGAEQHVGNRA